MIIFMVFIPFQVISLKMMSGDEVPVPVAPGTMARAYLP
jgi:hypothetical protein